MNLDPLATAIFFCSVFVAAAGAVVVSGFLPFASRPRAWWSGGRIAVLGLSVLFILLLVAGAISLALELLSWTAAVIAGGLAVLLAPMGFEALPRSLKNEAGGLYLFLALGAGTLLVQNLL